MKKINKFALAAIAVVSIVMILSTGIAAAKQTSVESPLLRVRATRALGVENLANNSEVCALDLKSKDIFGTSCPASCCTICNSCTSCDICTILRTCQLQNDSFGMGYEINSF